MERTWRAAIPAALALAILAVPVVKTAFNAREDFVYAYAASRMYWGGGNPYDRLEYQEEVAALLGEENPFPSGAFASTNAPAFFFLMGPTSVLPYDQAFRFWNIVLFLSLAAAGAAALGLLGSKAGSLEGLAVAAALASFPGVYHSVLYHRMTIPLLAAFLVGMVLWEKGKTRQAAIAWGFLAAYPPVFAFIVAALLVAGKRREAAAASWLAVLQLLPYAAGLRPLADWPALWSSMAEHARLGFTDGQSLAACGERLSLCLSSQGCPSGPLLPTGQEKVFFNWAPLILAGVFLWLYRRRLGAAAAFLPAAAVLASPYSHAGDAAWAFPVLIWVWRAAKEEGVPLFWAAMVTAAVNLVVLPDYFRPELDRWLKAGFWTAGYLSAAGAVWALLRAARPGTRRAARS